MRITVFSEKVKHQILNQFTFNPLKKYTINCNNFVYKIANSVLVQFLERIQKIHCWFDGGLYFSQNSGKCFIKQVQVVVGVISWDLADMP